MSFIIRLLAIIVLLITSLGEEDKEYFKEYHKNGKIKSEGWVINNKKSGYWKFYFENGSLANCGHFHKDQKSEYWHYYYGDGIIKKEGHYLEGAAIKWWIFYDQKGQIIHKCQLRNGLKDGYCLKYKDQELTSAEKYSNGKKIDEWFSFTSFKKENKLSDLK